MVTDVASRRESGVAVESAPVDLASDRLVVNPYPEYDALRGLGPVCRSAVWDAYCVTSYDLCRRVLARDEVFDSYGQQLLRQLQAGVLRGATSWRTPPCPPVPDGFPAQRLEGRRTTGRALATRFVDALWPRFEADCTATVAALLGSGGPVDLVADYAVPVVTRFLADLMAVAPEDRPVFGRWVESGYARQPAGTADDSQAMWRLLATQAVSRLRSPVDDFVGHLVAHPGVHRTDGSPLTAHLEFVVSTGLMISRVTHQGLVLSASTLLRALATHPDQYALLRRRRDLVPGTVEEGLRYDGSTQALGRLTRADTRLGDVVVPRDSLVIVFVGAANRDGTQWTDPDRFDVTRDTRSTARNLSFGHGVSSCLGATMSRRLLAQLLGALVGQVGELVPRAGERWFPEFMTRGLTSLPALVTAG